jgi:hypothetical protein
VLRRRGDQPSGWPDVHKAISNKSQAIGHKVLRSLEEGEVAGLSKILHHWFQIP